MHTTLDHCILITFEINCLRNITHMINFANTKDDRYLKFLLPMQSMTEDTIVRRKMVKKTQGTLDSHFHIR
jgi:hypothetical protein